MSAKGIAAGIGRCDVPRHTGLPTQGCDPDQDIDQSDEAVTANPGALRGLRDLRGVRYGDWGVRPVRRV